jgi:hypothetical protein
MIEILGHDLTSQQKVDHKNNDPLDNTRENLRNATNSENARNRKKKQGTSSNYVGVSKILNIYKSCIKVDENNITAYYNNELHAAHQYNLWVDKYNFTYANKNVIDIPSDFISYVKKQKTYNLPNGIRKSANGERFKTRLYIDGKEKTLGTFDTLEEAIRVINLAQEERKKKSIGENIRDSKKI